MLKIKIIKTSCNLIEYIKPVTTLSELIMEISYLP